MPDCLSGMLMVGQWEKFQKMVISLARILNTSNPQMTKTKLCSSHSCIMVFIIFETAYKNEIIDFQVGNLKIKKINLFLQLF